ncbi:hypothetical protein FACS189483_01380 [Spirochaetia bacterium]|nr:hypothetical protein FACS189483_01380 [Spirochaetia bacterium]
MKKYFKFILALASLCPLLASSCAPNEAPPYVVSKPICLIERMSGYFNFAGIEFDFFNAGEKNISDLYVSFIIYDADTKKNPLIGTNIIKVRFNDTIKRQELKKLYISLDSYIYESPAKPYLVDFFCITRISYDDGSLWEDPAGVYYTTSY